MAGVDPSSLDDGPMGSMANRVVGKTGRKLVSIAESGSLFQIVWKLLRRLTLVGIVGYAILLAALWLATSAVGERNVTSAFLLYLPPGLWLLPVAPLLFLGLVFHRKAAFAQLLCVALFVWGWMGYRFGHGREFGNSGNKKLLTIMTYNRGQHMNQSLQPFKQATQPDVLVMQEAPGRAPGFLKDPAYAEFIDGRSIGEFTLLSRFPIRDMTLVPGSPGRPIHAVRFAIDWHGTAVSIYTVHLQTPRDVLTSYQRGAFLWGILGLPGTPWAAKREHYQTFWDGQLDDATSLLNAVRADPNPAIIAGDFNAPHMGHLHRLVTRELGDAHHDAGQGFGFTFPGTTRNPLSLGGPWMRIDYVFFNKHFKAAACSTEPDRPSQHRAVAAQFSLVD